MPEWKNQVRKRLASLKLSPLREAEIVEELAQHLEDRYKDLQVHGASEEEAAHMALVEFFENEMLTRGLRRVERPFNSEIVVLGARRRKNMISDIWQDLRYGMRMLGKSRGFTLVAVLSLALGIGANTAIFSVVDAVLLKTLPVKDPNRLVVFNWEAGQPFRSGGIRGTFVPWGYTPGKRGSSSFRSRIYEAMRAEHLREPNSPLSDLFAFASVYGLNVVADDLAESTLGQFVSGNYFDGLGVAPLIGRTITEADDNPSAEPVAVISHKYWQERFGADPSVIGKQISVNKNTFTIIGVAPPGFVGAGQIDARPTITVPIAFQPVLESEMPMVDRPGRPGISWLQVMGRLKPEATMEQARESLNGVFQSLSLELMPPPRRENEPAQIEPKDYPNLIARPGAQGMWEIRSVYSTTVYMLMGVVGLILLIACANVANLLLARAALRAPEITVRLAVGAGRWRLVQQLLTESLLLAAMGGAVGVLFAIWGKEMLTTMGDSLLPAGFEYPMSWRVLGFTIAISLLTGILFGLAPAWRATSLDLTSSLKESNRASVGLSRSRLSKVLVIAQVAMSLILLIGAGLYIRTLRNLEQVDLGFNKENLLLFSIQPRTLGYKEERLRQVYTDVFERLSAIPGVRSATFGNFPLVAHYVYNINLIMPDETAESNAERTTNKQSVRDNYFSTMQIPLLRGRSFTEKDDQRALKVALVSETFVRKYFPDEDPIGKRVGFDSETVGKIEIIGIVGDIKYNSHRDEEPMIYTHWLQDNGSLDMGEMSFALRTAGEPTALVSNARQAVSEVDPNLPLINVKTQEQQVNDSLMQERVFARLLSLFGALALLLAGIGLYGLMAYSVTQRKTEIGIRMALGAQALDVLKLVIWQGMILVIVGLGIGAIGAYGLKKLVESQDLLATVENQLYGVQTTDPTTLVLVVVLLIIAGVLACWIPARRASQVDPMSTLRNE
jgi:predicted permease